MNAVRKKLSELDEVKRVRLYQDVFKTVEGQLVLEDLRERGFMYLTPFDPGKTEFNAGMQAFVMHINSFLDRELEPIAFPKPEGEIENE